MGTGERPARVPITWRRAAGILMVIGAASALHTAGPVAGAAEQRGKGVKGRSFAKQELKHEDFRNLDLQGADFTSATLRNATFAGSDLRGAIFRGAILSEADLTGADLRGADLMGASFGSAKATRANLEDQELYLAGSEMFFEKIKDLPFGIREYAKPDLNNGTLTFQAANLRNTRIHGNLERVDFRRADLRGADLTKATGVSSAIFRGAIYDSRTKWSIDVAESGAVKGEEAPVPATWFVGLWGIEKERPGEPEAARTGRLRILGNGTFEWDAGDEKLVTGKWEAAPSAPGAPPQIRISRGELGLDWTAQQNKEDLILKSGDGKKARIAFRG